jgi:hypothetical protein
MGVFCDWKLLQHSFVYLPTNYFVLLYTILVLKSNFLTSEVQGYKNLVIKDETFIPLFDV